MSAAEGALRLGAEWGLIIGAGVGVLLVVWVAVHVLHVLSGDDG